MSNTPKSNEPKAADPADPNQGSPASINEPPGSNVHAAPPASPPTTPAPEPEVQPLPSVDELHAMKRAELDNLAEERGVDISHASNKDEVIELLRKDARKRK